MKNGLHITASKNLIGWVGFVEFWKNDEKIYSTSCQILRCCKKDALDDARIEKEHLEYISNQNYKFLYEKGQNL